jgi:mycothiol synthase
VVSPFPEGWTTRRPTLDDIPAILAVVHASDIAAIGEPDFNAEDVQEALTSPYTDPAEDCWLAVDPSGRVVGWAYPENPSAGERDFVEVYVHPDHGLPAQRPLLDLMLRRVAVRATAFGHDPITVRAGAIPTEKSWVETLTAAGFSHVNRYARMRRTLTDLDPTPPVPPDGVTIRPLDPDDETEMRQFHAVVEEAFVDTRDHLPIGYAAWREQLAKLPSLAYDEWFVAEVDGRWAGVLQSTDQSLEQEEGFTKVLAVLRPYRRRGIGAALLRRAFVAYAAKGRIFAGLGVDLGNPTQAVRLYHAVGMTPVYEADMYERTVAAAR